MVPISRRFVLFSIIAFCAFPLIAETKQYPIFDGQFYNNKYYPRVDIIEWGAPPHLEFHIYSKEEPIEISAKATEHNGRRVLLVSYFFTKRKEKLCRRVLAPANFSPDTKLYFYKDGSDKEYDNIYVSVVPMKPTKKLDNYANKEYSSCDEPAESPKPQRGVASNPAPTVLIEKNEGSIMHKRLDQANPSDPPKHQMIDYENHAVPFNY